MFAIALWDRVERRLSLVRDRFGEKPMYYGWTRNAFVFGSEVKALRLYPGFDNQLDSDVLALYMRFCYVPTPYAIYRHVYKLEPGCLLSLSLADAVNPPVRALVAPARHGGLRIERYWTFDNVVRQGLASPLQDEAEAIDQVEATLSEAVRLQSIADVPLGAFLSGGIDSSTIAALMQAQSSRQVKTFTIGFDETGFNEADQAKAIAGHLGTDHSELYVSAQQARDVIPKLPELYSEPFADSSQIPTFLVSQMARSKITVALSGDGGDELFGGYNRYSWGRRIWKHMRVFPPVVRRRVAAAIQRVPVARWDALGSMLPGRPGLARIGDRAHKLAYRLARVNSLDELYLSLVTEWPADVGVVREGQPLRTLLDDGVAAGDVPDAEHRMMSLDTRTYLPDDILHKVDRAAMGVGLETRVPFLDHRVAELAWRLPLSMKIRNGQGKWVLRQLLHRYVPREMSERPKMGFGVPIDSWLRGPLREWAEALLDEGRLRREGVFDPTPIRAAWVQHLSGARNLQQQIWAVLMFQSWLEHSRR
jgi:asparagine synthase (glutamine-hydrolysing)